MHRTFWGAAALAVVTATLLLTACANTAIPENLMGVNSLTADPQAFTGEIAVEGVVIDVDPASSRVRLIDLTEYETCGLNPCGSAGVLPLHLPVTGEPTATGALYEGELPSLEDAVVVVGEVRSGQSGLYFDVQRVQRGSQTLISKR